MLYSNVDNSVYNYNIEKTSVVIPKRTSSLIIYHNYKTKSYNSLSNSRSSVYSNCSNNYYVSVEEDNDVIDTIINMYF